MFSKTVLNYSLFIIIIITDSHLFHGWLYKMLGFGWIYPYTSIFFTISM